MPKREVPTTRFELGDSRVLLKPVKVFDFMMCCPPMLSKNTELDREEQLSMSMIDAVARQAGRTAGWALTFVDQDSYGAWRDAFEANRAVHRIDLLWSRYGEARDANLKPAQCFQLIPATCPEGLVDWYGPQEWRGFDSSRVKRPRAPQEKPLDLALEAVQYFSSIGDFGIDPCCGSGTFAIAAWLLDRHMLGIERNPDRLKVAQERLAEYKSGVIPKRDERRIVQYLLKHPESVDRVLCKFKNPWLVRSFMRQAVNLEKKKLREMIVQHLSDDSVGDRTYESLVKGLYSKKRK